MNREGRLVKNTFILAIGTFFPKLAVFLALPILTAYLTKEEYGTYDLVVTMVALLLPVATLQIQAAAFRFLVDRKNDIEGSKQIISSIYIFVTVVSVIVLSIGFLLLGNLQFTVRISVFLYYLFDIFSNVSRQVVRGMGRNLDYTISATISGVGQIAFICLLVIGLDWRLLGGLVALTIAEFFSTVFLVFRAKLYNYILPRYLDKSLLKEMLFYSWPLVPNSIAQWIIHASDRIIVSSFLGISANAVYSVAYKIPSILTLVQTTFNMAWQENATETIKDSDAHVYYSNMFRLLFDFAAGMMSILIGMSPILFYIFVRGDYSEAYNHMPLLSLGMFFLCISSFWGGIFIATKRTKTSGTTTVIAAIVNLSIDLLTIRWIGLYAASISSLAAYMVMCIVRALSVQRFMKLKYDIPHIIIVLTVLIVQSFVCSQQKTVLDVLNIATGFGVCIVLNYKLIKASYKKILGWKSDKNNTAI